MIKVDFSETVSRGKLVADSRILLNTLLFCIASAIAVYILYTYYDGAEDAVLRRIYGYMIAPVLLSYILFALYKKFRERQMYTIDSHLPVAVKKKIVADYIADEDMYLNLVRDNYLIATRKFSLKQRVQLTAIFTDDTVLINIISYSSGLGIPLFFYDSRVKKGIQNVVARWNESNGDFPQKRSKRSLR